MTEQTQPTDAELLPCPFCGGLVNLEETTSYYDEMYGNRQWWGVVCRNTTNRGGSCAIQQRPSASKEAAVERWNRRAPQPTQAQTGAVPLIEEQCEISSQGPRMSHALSETHGDVCIVYVDFGSKRFNVSGSGSDDEVPSVSIDPCDQLQGWECADVVFPNRKGWDVVSASSSKYTLTAVLKRKGADHG